MLKPSCLQSVEEKSCSRRLSKNIWASKRTAFQWWENQIFLHLFDWCNHWGKCLSSVHLIILSSTVAHIISGDPELEGHCAELWAGQLEGGSRCSANLCPSWRLCPSLWCVTHKRSSILFMLWLASRPFFYLYLFYLPNNFFFSFCPPTILNTFFKSIILLYRYPGRPVGAWGHREALPSGLFVLHLLWEHWEASGVLGFA